MSEPLSAVVVGAGYFAGFHIDAWQRLADVTLRAIVEIDNNKHQALQQSHPGVTIVRGIEELTFDPDIVDIATPPTTHVPQIQLALNNTSALIICQKPFCGTLDAAQRMVNEAQTRQRKIVVHENFRFQPWYRQLKQLMQNQLIGQVQQATFRLRPGDGQGPQAYLERQPYFQDMPRFLIHETGIHFIDVFRFLFGEPDALSADLRKLNPAIQGEDAGCFNFIYDHGLRAVFDGNRHIDHAARNTRTTMGEMLIEGTTGTLTLNGDGDILYRKFGTVDLVNMPYTRSDYGFAADCVFLLQQHVVNHLRHATALENTAGDYLKNQQLEALVYEANETRRTLAVN
ncbi:MAG: Gfo/Idh/MocA family oxidoreductase [Pseudomonadota bacterium]